MIDSADPTRCASPRATSLTSTSSATPQAHRCPTCQIVKNLDQFAPDKTKSSGRRFRCRPCDAARSRAAYARSAARRSALHDQPKRAPSYNWTRRRLRRARGSASAQLCSCGAQAHHWAYDHTDPNELVGDTGRGIVAAYSLDLGRYEPRCSRCHAIENAGRKTQRLRDEVAALRVALWLVTQTCSAAPRARTASPPVRVPSDPV